MKPAKRKRKSKQNGDKVLLGVLLRGLGRISEADNKFHPLEEEKMRDIILSRTNILRRDFPVVLSAMRQAAIGNNGFSGHLRMAGRALSHEMKVSVLNDFMRVALADGKCDEKERAFITESADLLGVDLSAVEKCRRYF